MLLHIDGYDHYNTAQMTTAGKITGVNSGAGSTLSIAAGGRSGSSFRIVVSTGDGPGSRVGIFKTFVPGDNKCIFGGSYKTSAIAPTVPIGILAITDGGVAQISIRRKPDGTFEALRGDAHVGTLLGTSTAFIASGAHYHLQLKVLIHNSTGTLDLVLNGVNILSLINIDTQATANATWNGIFWGNKGDGISSPAPFSFGAAETMDYDDCWVCDGVDGTATQGAPNNSFLGDLIIPAPVMWTSDGNYTQFTGVGTGSAQYDRVNDNPANDETNYLKDAVVGHRTSGNCIIPAGGPIVALSLDIYTRKDDGGPRSIRGFVRIGGTDYDGAVDIPLGFSYQFRSAIFGINPATGVAWVPGTFDFGVKVTV